MTFRSRKRESEEMNSSDIPSEKYSFAGSPVELTIGSTAIDFSGMAALFVAADGGDNTSPRREERDEHERGDSSALAALAVRCFAAVVC